MCLITKKLINSFLSNLDVWEISALDDRQSLLTDSEFSGEFVLQIGVGIGFFSISVILQFKFSSELLSISISLISEFTQLIDFF